MLGFDQMKKAKLTKEVPRLGGVAPGGAGDQVDQAVNKIVRALKHGRSARLPGIGTISPGKPWVFRA